MIRFENGGLEFDETLTQLDIDAIAQYASQAQRIQIEHIIKLVSQFLDDAGSDYCFECGYWNDLKPALIKLIKGDK